jgi:hypothetical protein
MGGDQERGRQTTVGARACRLFQKISMAASGKTWRRTVGVLLEIRELLRRELGLRFAHCWGSRDGKED